MVSAVMFSLLGTFRHQVNARKRLQVNPKKTSIVNTLDWVKVSINVKVTIIYNIKLSDAVKTLH